jgi:hypothetical protein
MDNVDIEMKFVWLKTLLINILFLCPFCNVSQNGNDSHENLTKFGYKLNILIPCEKLNPHLIKQHIGEKSSLVKDRVTTMRKRGVLQFNFWVVNDICISLYLYIVGVNGQITWTAKLQLTIYTMQLIVIQLQLNQNNLFSTIMQLHYSHTHGAMLTSLIVMHLLKFDMWHYKKIWTYLNFFSKYWSPWSIILLMMVQNCDMWNTIIFLPHGILINKISILIVK